ncbi:hypothetical protein NDU88_004002 [Pleurodeles waltl]|uniref:Uncharacterized protein n=1 Tax=Pleurodeles waltl TaxID=8319 RepID=A0AAV7T6W5_PLEWA|nr:hypothetical protein NDU88_004002 [Pleurodeles waltl]
MFISWKTRQRAPLPGDARGSDVYLPEGASTCSVAKEMLAAIPEQHAPATVSTTKMGEEKGYNKIVPRRLFKDPESGVPSREEREKK